MLFIISILVVGIIIFALWHQRHQKYSTSGDRVKPAIVETTNKIEVCNDSSAIWVGAIQDKLLVVFDKEIQPSDSSFIYIYYVNGNSMCTRNADDERRRFRTVKDNNRVNFALVNYLCWKKNNTQEIKFRKALTDFVIETPGLARDKCPDYKGEPKSVYSVGSFAEGSQSDGVRIVDICNRCSGAGYIDILACNIYKQ
ncbi:hypothetical protein [Rheinheimera sp. 4Y26]|uniref:hypothetical protein n=1 Tax=Rheinheimera sp. 4Y26 TaxID=2977811 RepID=UPI0021B0A853|nr:hypothetical protein [Rheinheimera sp. 4Y26]MCT6700975.1 hypothetical protein [Rheinheimera sp. 4Y26]